MDNTLFLGSLEEEAPPVGSSIFLQALWWERKGNWQKAHSLVEELAGADAALVHAYLHWAEGDSWNSDYWYRRAGKTKSGKTTDEEWEMLVSDFLKK